jgi:hypothetical protein
VNTVIRAPSYITHIRHSIYLYVSNVFQCESITSKVAISGAWTVTKFGLDRLFRNSRWLVNQAILSLCYAQNSFWVCGNQQYHAVIFCSFVWYYSAEQGLQCEPVSNWQEDKSLSTTPFAQIRRYVVSTMASLVTYFDVGGSIVRFLNYCLNLPYEIVELLPWNEYYRLRAVSSWPWSLPDTHDIVILLTVRPETRNKGTLNTQPVPNVCVRQSCGSVQNSKLGNLWFEPRVPCLCA